MAGLSVSHEGDRIVFTFTVAADELNLDGLVAGGSVSASTEQTGAAPEIDPATGEPREQSQEPASPPAP